MDESTTTRTAQGEPSVMIPVPDGMPVFAPISVPPPTTDAVEDSVLGFVHNKTLVDLTSHTDDEIKTHSPVAWQDSEKALERKAEKMESTDPEDLDNEGNNASTGNSTTMTFPDGGFGWVVVLGAFMIQFW